MTHRAALYCRVSTDVQRETGTIQTQLGALRALAAEQGWSVIAEVLDDGVSGAIPPHERPGGRELIALVARKEVDVVAVVDLDRVSRDADGIDLPVFLRHLREHGVGLWTPRGEQRADTPESRLMQGLLGAIAGYERAKIRERTHRGRQRSIREGGRPRGWSLLGYDWSPEERRFVVHPEQAAVVRETFRLAAEEGLGPFAIARRLKAAGLRGSRGKFMADTTVELVLLRSLYFDGAYYPEPEALPDVVHRVEPLIDEATWLRAAEALARKATRAPLRLSDYPFLLRRRGVCAHCGRALRAQHSYGRYPYYRCQYGINAPINKQRCTATKGLRAEVVDAAVWKTLCRLIREPGALAAEVARAAQEGRQSVEEIAAELAVAEQEVDRLQARVGRLVAAVADGLLSREEVSQARREIDEALVPARRRRDLLAAQVQAATRQKVTLGVVEERLEELRAALDHLTDDERIAVVAELVERAVVDVMSGEIRLEVILLSEDDDDPSGQSGGNTSGGGAGSTFYGSQSSPIKPPTVAAGPSWRSSPATPRR